MVVVSCWIWEPNSYPLQEQQVLITIKPISSATAKSFLTIKKESFGMSEFVVVLVNFMST